MNKDGVTRAEPITVTRNGRRYFSREYKQAVVQACLVPGASIAAVALAHGFNANLVRRWLVEEQRRAAAAGSRLVPVVIDESAAPSTTANSAPARAEITNSPSDCKSATAIGTIELQVGTARLSVRGPVDERTLASVVKAMGGWR